MPDRHKQFPLGFEAGTPDWSLLNVPHVSTSPAMLWRQQNLDTRTPDEHCGLVALLRNSLGIHEREYWINYATY